MSTKPVYDGPDEWAERFAGRKQQLMSVQRLVDARDEAYVKAIDNLGRYKFDRFGYFAARWVTLNHLLPKAHQAERGSHPFHELIVLARVMSQRPR